MDERFPYSALGRSILAVHIVGMESGLGHLLDAVHMSGFGRENTGVLEMDAVSQVDDVPAAADLS